MKSFSLSASIDTKIFGKVHKFVESHFVAILFYLLLIVSIGSFMYFLSNGLSLSYNDARSHLDIGRRVVEGLKPGLAQIGSVWLPLPHLLMLPTVWNDFMWHTGLAGSIQSMASFIFTGILIALFLKELGVGLFGRIVGVLIFVLNINVLYMQSTAMTELLLLATMTAGSYFLLVWHRTDKVFDLIKASAFIMLATLIRYDGWFLFLIGGLLVFLKSYLSQGSKAAEGKTLFFATLAGLGIILWLLWNLLIFKDPFYFAFGPYSAHAQQTQLDSAGVLQTKGNLPLSLAVYLYALSYNSYAFILFLGAAGAVVLALTKSLKSNIKIATMALLAPLVFNIVALYFGHSVLFLQNFSGDTWFNVRYGLMMMPSIAIFVGYLVGKSKKLNYALIPVLIFVLFFAFGNGDAVTIDDARVGSSQKNVSQVSGWLGNHAKDKPGFILISAASHDAIIFSSGLPMKKFIHEGTGAYWESATTAPDRWARWIVMRTNDVNDITFKAVSKTQALKKYNLVAKYPFADVYEIKPEFVSQLHTTPSLGKQK